MKKTITLLTILSVIILTACAGAKAVSAGTQNDLYNKTWKLKQILTDTAKFTVETKATLIFDAQKKSAGGNGSCNTFGSSVSINGNELSFSNIFSTKMYCDEVQQTENRYLSQLGKVSTYRIDGNTLTLLSDGKVVLIFEAQ